MPTYNISDEQHTEVMIHGELINENYSRLLKKHPELSLDDVIALDKVQKKLPVGEANVQRLRDLKLVLGLDSNLFIPGSYPTSSYNDCKNLILNYIRINKSATREDIDNLISPLLFEDEPAKKQKKISNIISKLAYTDKKIKNTSQSVKYPVWELLNSDADGSNNKKK